MYNPYWYRLYKDCGLELPKGVRLEVETRDDVVYDQKNGERVGRLKLLYFQTRNDYNCEECNSDE